MDTSLDAQDDDSIMFNALASELYGTQPNHDIGANTRKNLSDLHSTAVFQPDIITINTNSHDSTTDIHSSGDMSQDEQSYPETKIEVMDEQSSSGLQEIAHLYESYHHCYANSTLSKEMQMERAKAFALGLLEYYYPKDQQFLVEPVSFDVMAKNGWSFLLNQDEDVDSSPDPDPAVNGGSKIKSSHRGRKVGRTKKAVSSREFDLFSSKWHHIGSENITGFVVQRRYTLTELNGTIRYEYFPHTYLGIMIDDLSTFRNWNMALSSSLDRGDLLSFSLGVHAKIEKGYGILMLGPRLEFYRYSNSAATPMTRYNFANGMDWALDTRHAHLQAVDRAFRLIAGKDVFYQNRIIGKGVQT